MVAHPQGNLGNIAKQRQALGYRNGGYFLWRRRILRSSACWEAILRLFAYEWLQKPNRDVTC